MTAKKLLRNGCMSYLDYVIDSRNEEVELTNISIVREFPYVFSKELLKFPVDKEVEVPINIILGTTFYNLIALQNGTIRNG
jgi:hypothetical protein